MEPEPEPEPPPPRRAVCGGCRRPPAVCLCSSLPSPRLRTATRVVVLMHPKEAKRKVVKTADLIGLCLAEGCCEVYVEHDFGGVLEALARQQQPQDRCLLLWPGAEATPIDSLGPSRGSWAPWEPEPEPEPELEPEPEPETAVPGCPRTTLIVLDGTWQQAKTMHARNAAALSTLCSQVSFPEGGAEPSAPAPTTAAAAAADDDDKPAASSGWIRIQPRDHFLSTLESVGLALRSLEGPGAESGGPFGANTSTPLITALSGDISDRLLAALVYATLLRVFKRMNELQRVFYTAEKAFAPGVKKAKDDIKALPATLTDPSELPADAKPKLFVLMREGKHARNFHHILIRRGPSKRLLVVSERTAADKRVMRPCGEPVLCTFDQAQRQCKEINQTHGRTRGNRFCVRTPHEHPEETDLQQEEVASNSELPHWLRVRMLYDPKWATGMD